MSVKVLLKKRMFLFILYLLKSRSVSRWTSAYNHLPQASIQAYYIPQKAHFGGTLSRWAGVNIKSPPADSSGSPPNVNHILESESTCLGLRTPQPGNTKPSVCRHKAPKEFTAVNPPEKESRYESSAFLFQQPHCERLPLWRHGGSSRPLWEN